MTGTGPLDPTPSPAPAGLGGRALVLGAGGIAGVAWLSGLLAAVEEHRVALGGADLVVGTSAGAIVAARVAGGNSMQAQVRLLAGRRSVFRATLTAAYRLMPVSGDLDAVIGQIAAAPASTAESRRQAGRRALAAKTMPERAFVGLVRAVVRMRAWPATPVMLVAVDAGTGEVRPLTRGDAVRPARAAAASAAVPEFYPPVHVGGRPLIDGGSRSATNADLAAGHATIVVIADHVPIATGAGPLSRAQIDGEVAALRATGARVLLVEPDERSAVTLAAALDPRGIVPAAREGVRQGREGEAARIAEAWSS